jgi:hypothetical protein
MIRQGDVLLVPVLGLPKKVSYSPHRILAVGEVMGHAHRFESSAVVLVVDSHFNLFCKVRKPAELIHEEHENIRVPPGNYMVVQQRQLNSDNLTVEMLDD